MIGLLLGLLLSAQAAPPALYMVMVDRFANGDPSNDADADTSDPVAFHGGDLEGIRTHLNHIESLGFNQVWLSPITQMRTQPIGGHGAFHGYWVTDGSTLEPRFGTDAQFSALRSEMAQRKMALVIDLVTNHVAPDAPLVRTHPEWFHRLGDIKDWSSTKERITHDVHGLPDLAQERPEVTEYLLKQAEIWWKDGQTPIRLDAVRHLPPAFVETLRAHFGTPASPAIVYGEIFEGNPVTLAEQAKQYHLDHTFDFPLHYALVNVFCRDADAREIAQVLSVDDAYAPGHTHLTFLDNHDLPRIRTLCEGDETRVQDAMAFMLTLRGVPVVTYGTEAGLSGQSEIEARGDMDFDRKAPVAQAIKDGLARRARIPDLATAPTVISEASKDSLTLMRPGPKGTVKITWTRDAGVKVSAHTGPDYRSPKSPLLVPLKVPEVPLKAGETLWLSGSSSALGGWDPNKATGPLRVGSTIQLPMKWGRVVATKLLIKDSNGKVTWAHGGNQFQTLDVHTGHPKTENLRWPAP